MFFNLFSVKTHIWVNYVSSLIFQKLTKGEQYQRLWMLQKETRIMLLGFCYAGWDISVPEAQVMEMYFYINLPSLLGLF